ncbi:hypothetical protein [Paraburkholderia sp.]|uniref:hypothetical protein n=1 Tax=Paraburkholderia sp. TaxID=1926495 RepID=UPI003D6F146B
MMTWIFIALLAAGFIVWGATRYRPVFADRHFVEVARNVAQIKAAALEQHGDDGYRPADDPRAQVTTAGLALVYTIVQRDDRFIHHYSVSIPGGVTPHAVGERFILFVARLLGVPFDTLALSSSESSTVHHAQFQLSQSGQEVFATRPVPEVTKIEIAAFRTEFNEARKDLRWTRVA